MTFPPNSGPDIMSESTWTSVLGEDEEHANDEALRDRDRLRCQATRTGIQTGTSQPEWHRECDMHYMTLGDSNPEGTLPTAIACNAAFAGRGAEPTKQR